jgi:hypothetical protein
MPPRYHQDWMDRIGWYRIVKKLGRGAMGVVYHAIDPHIGRRYPSKPMPGCEYRRCTRES